MTLSDLTKSELQDTLRSLKRLHEASIQDFQRKQVQYAELSEALGALAQSVKNIEGSIAAVNRALGLPQEQAAPLATAGDGETETVDTTRTVMNIIASKHDSGGITFDQVFQSLKDQGVEISREYLHTILNRKKNRQKKLEKRGDKWFLTDKGKEELGM